MNKLSKLFAGLAVVALAASCSNDEPAPDGGQTKPQGDLAYMNIMIKSSENSRADEYNPSWDVAAEHTVTDARFFFFDEDGVKAEVEANWANPEFDQNGTGKPNIEYVGKNAVLVLEGLQGNDYPKYMLTVLNIGQAWDCPATLKEAAEQLQNLAVDKFVMTTSSYLVAAGETASDTHHQDFDNAKNLATYYATTLTPDDFFRTPEEATTIGKAVEIYVERLAAKVQVEVTAKPVAGHDDLYELPVTLGGSPNEGDNTDNVLDTKLYVRVLGWNLNATSKESYLSKQLESAWLENSFLNAWSWNNSNDFRSFWAKSAPWGSTVDEGEDAVNDKLNYIVTAQSKAKKVGLGTTNDKIAYCYEYTNEPANYVQANGEGEKMVNNRNHTHVVLDTEVGELVDGVFQPLNLITYRGILYREEAYESYILNKVHAAGKLNYYTMTTVTIPGVDGATDGSKTTYVQMDDTYFKTEAHENGEFSQVDVVLDETKLADVQFYAKSVDETGNDTYTPTEVNVEELKAALAAAQSANHPACQYTGGRSFYYIPIQHLGAGVVKIDELGYYGVVRNHQYQLNITQFSRIGHAVFNPDSETEIVLPPNKPESPLYYVGANINILSWKIVTNNVIL